MHPAKRHLLDRTSPACKRWATLLCLALVVGAASATQAVGGESACGELSNGQNGPFDYRKERGQRLVVVEVHHFTPKVEALIAGESTTHIAQDLDYTLRAFPNHHRALLALMRFSDRLKTDNPPASRWPVECYFDRALRFVPDDTVVRQIYAKYLATHGRRDEALLQLSAVRELAGDNAFTHYNLGLMYYELKMYEDAVRQAHRAAELGFARRELRQRLEAAGKWVEPAAAPGEAPSAGASR